MTSPTQQGTAEHYSWQGEDLILHCHLQPKAAKDEIVGVHGGRLKIRITAPPVDGKANQHLVSWLSKLFKTPKGNIEIIQGELGRLKTLRIHSAKVLPTLISECQQ
ncbi:MAG: YggU family protein [Gammaproteobacteria bacterium]|nr:MAG: YggU family protein [Gammaproteobacteria bacterium]